MTFYHLQGPVHWMLILHVAAGAIALGVFLVPMLARKGSQLHVRTGWIYVLAMAVVATTSWMITPWRVFMDPARTPSTQAFAAFLFLWP